MPQETPAGPRRAPEFPPGLSWLNVDHALNLGDLRGKVVLLHFWNYGRISCPGRLRDLRRLEKRFARDLVILGVHGARFAQERETTHIRAAILRLEIEHPVVNDLDREVWKLYAAQAPCSVCLIDPEGMLSDPVSAEGGVDALDESVAILIQRFEAEGKLNHRPVGGLRREAPETPVGPGGLLFPGQVLCDPEGGRLFVADSGHHRIVVADLETGAVQRTIGGMKPGLVDGAYPRARFRNPQGLALRGDLLLVADTDNHMIREIDLTREIVRTVAGTGEQLRRPAFYGIRWPARLMQLDSPCGLALAGETLYIAMAGCHQIWRLDLEMEELALHAGSGAEGLIDGHHRQAALAQPSGITTDGKALYLADSEASALRRAGLGSDGEVMTLAGTALLEFGHQDGPVSAARLQHPQGILWHEGKLFVADTFNSAIRIMDPATRVVRTLVGPSREPGAADSPAALDEPAALSAAGEFLFVADTNHHRVCRLRLKDGQRTDWDLGFLAEAESPAADAAEASEGPEEQVLEEVEMAAGHGHFHFDLRMPSGYRLNRTAPFELTASGDGAVVEVIGGPFQLRTGDPSFPITIPLQLQPGDGLLQIVLVLYYCEAPEMRLCYYQSLRLRAPLRVLESGGKPEARVLYHLEVPSAPI